MGRVLPVALLFVAAAVAVVTPLRGDARGALRQCRPCLELEGFSLEGHYVESRLVNGVLVLVGRLSGPAQVRARLHFGNVAPARATWQSQVFSLPEGDFAERADLPGSLLPGPYVLEVVTNPGDGAEQRLFDSLRIPAPAEGVVILAWATSRRTGLSHIARIKGRPARVWAFFRFASTGLPRRGSRLAVTWYAPSGKAIAAPLRKPRRFDVATFVQSSSGLPRGRWRCVLRADGVVVKQVRLRIG